MYTYEFSPQKPTLKLKRRKFKYLENSRQLTFQSFRTFSMSSEHPVFQKSFVFHSTLEFGSS